MGGRREGGRGSGGEPLFGGVCGGVGWVGGCYCWLVLWTECVDATMVSLGGDPTGQVSRLPPAPAPAIILRCSGVKNCWARWFGCIRGIVGIFGSRNHFPRRPGIKRRRAGEPRGGRIGGGGFSNFRQSFETPTISGSKNTINLAVLCGMAVGNRECGQISQRLRLYYPCHATPKRCKQTTKSKNK